MRIKPQSQNLYLQEKSNWCWAAGAGHIADCLSAYVTQCNIAANCLSLCGAGCNGDPCNIPYYLHLALEKVRHYGKWMNGRVTPKDVIAEIDAGRPLGIRVRWGSGQNGHFVVIVGYGESPRQSNALFYVIFDPNPDVGLHAIRASSLMEGGYQCTGTWSETIFTKP